MTAPLTATRHALADAITQVVPDGTTVSAAPGSNVAAPSVRILAGEGGTTTSCLWACTWHIELVGPGGDNEAGLTALEDLTALVVDAVHGAYRDADLNFDAPATTIVAGAAYLTQTLTATILSRVTEG